MVSSSSGYSISASIEAIVRMIRFFISRISALNEPESLSAARPRLVSVFESMISFMASAFVKSDFPLM